MERYPIDRDKVAALKESFQSTGFWENIVGRVNENGDAEIAYGHHRIIALEEEYGDDYEFNLIIKDLDESAMLQMMVRENNEVYHGSAKVEQESIRAVLMALSDGTIGIDVADKGKSQHVSDFILISGNQKDTEISERGLEGFTGISYNKVKFALTALKAVLDEKVKDSDFDGVTSTQANVIVQEVEKTERLAPKGEAPEVTKKRVREVAETLREGFVAEDKKQKVTKRTAPEVARQIRERDKGEKAPADINESCESMNKAINKMLKPVGDKVYMLDELVKYGQHLDSRRKRNLISVLEQLGERALNYAAAISGEPVEMRLVSGDKS